MSNRAVIVDGVRTPIGAMNGALASLSAPELGGACIKALLDRQHVSPAAIDEVIMGEVLQAGVGQNPARQAALAGGIPASVGATTVNKVCGSGLKAVMLGAQSIRLGDSSLLIAGGMESMSRAPYLLPKARQGYRLGHAELIDAMIHDGLWDVYGKQSMGVFGDRCAAKFGFSRRDQDDFAVRSFQRAQAASREGRFDSQIIPVTLNDKAKTVVRLDEGPEKFNEGKLRMLPPAFHPEGTVTAANASSINDGAAALLLASESKAKALGLKPRAVIVGSSTFSQEPEWFTTAPIGAIRRLIEQVGWSIADVDRFEINEAFAAVTMAAIKDLHLSPDRVNVDGGAVALGHPIGASGARILVTLLCALERSKGRKGIASLCLGGGEAVALAVERLDA